MRKLGAQGPNPNRKGGLAHYTETEDALLKATMRTLMDALPHRSYGSLTTRMETLWRRAHEEGGEL